jgi:hypothetical protein
MRHVIVPESEIVNEVEAVDAATTVRARTNFGADSLWL